MAPIERVVVLMLENQSFDRMLGGLRIAGLEGVQPERPRENPDWPTGAPVRQRPSEARTVAHDPGHELDDVLRQVSQGAMDGFVADFAALYPHSSPDERAEIMAYYPQGFLPALHMLGREFVIADQWYSSVPGPTWPNRLFAQSGTSLGHTDMPDGIFHPGLHLYDQRTIYDELAARGVRFRIYYGDFPQSLVFTHQLEPERLACYRRYSHFEDDISAQDLPPFVFIEPAYFEPGENDQHPPQDVFRGDALIGTVYNALLAAPGLFARTLLVILYDEHGGFFDHAPPPATIAPDDHTGAFDFARLGVRVPAVLVSPLLDPGLVHAVFDHTSLIRAAAELWGIAPLGQRAAAANSPLSHLVWREQPRTGLGEAPVATAPAEPGGPALNAHTAALFSFSQYLESRIKDPAKRDHLMRSAYAAMDGAAAAGGLALARLDAFLEEPATG